MGSTKKSAHENKLLGLEIIRFVSAVAVLFWHYQHFFFMADQPVDFVADQQPFYEIFHSFYDYGYYGVQVFWCVSGFIFFWKYRLMVVENIIGAKSFLILRFSRLYPLHFVTLLIVAVLQWVYFSKNKFFFVYQNNDIAHFSMQLFMASNWGIVKGYSFNGPIWSISIEVLAYICFFMILRYFGGSFFINFIVITICVYAKYLGMSSPIFDCLALFYAGGLAGIAFQYTENRRISFQWNFLAWSCVIVAPVIFLFLNGHRESNYFLAFLLVFLPFFLLISASYLSVPKRAKNIVEAAGNMTYSSYLIHFPIQILTVLCFSSFGLSLPYYSGWFFSAFLGGTLIISYIVFRFFEAPAQKYIRDLMGKRS